MIVAAGVELLLGVPSERKALEDVAAPLTTERLPGRRVSPGRLTPIRDKRGT
jgi:hypothetical protein